MTTKKINKAISHLSLQIAGGRGEGYFYFVHTTEGALEADSVMVPALNHLPLSRWCEEAEEAWQQHLSRTCYINGVNVTNNIKEGIDSKPKVIILGSRG